MEWPPTPELKMYSSILLHPLTAGMKPVRKHMQKELTGKVQFFNSDFIPTESHKSEPTCLLQFYF